MKEVRMFIQVEDTPNPNARKFFPEATVLGAGSIEFTDEEGAAKSPLATLLFRIDGVSGVMLGADFVSISKTEDQDWETITPFILETLTAQFTSDIPLLNKIGNQSVHLVSEIEIETLDPISKQIVEIINTRVRPAVAQDGGDIVFKKFDNGIVYVIMKGACSGCPSSTATLKHGIENMLRHYVPEVTEVQAISA